MYVRWIAKGKRGKLGKMIKFSKLIMMEKGGNVDFLLFSIEYIFRRCKQIFYVTFTFFQCKSIVTWTTTIVLYSFQIFSLLFVHKIRFISFNERYVYWIEMLFQNHSTKKKKKHNFNKIEEGFLSEKKTCRKFSIH